MLDIFGWILYFTYITLGIIYVECLTDYVVKMYPETKPTVLGKLIIFSIYPLLLVVGILSLFFDNNK